MGSQLSLEVSKIALGFTCRPVKACSKATLTVRLYQFRLIYAGR